MNEFRKDMCIQAFILLDTTRMGYLTFQGLQARFTGAEAGKAGFVAQMDKNKDGKIMMKEWLEYYNTVSMTTE